MGALFCTGSQTYGEFGNEDAVSDYNSSTQIGTDTDWESVHCLEYASVLKKTNGTLWSTGYNDFGQLGLGNTDYTNVFTQIGSDNDWGDIKGIGSSMMVVKTGGTLWGTGWNPYGHLGQGNSTNLDIFTQVGLDTDWESVDLGNTHALAIKTDGSLWSCGWNNEGQLGQNNTTNLNTFTRVGSGNDWASVACSQGFAYGYGHSLAIKTDGSLWSCGDNTHGQLGLAYGVDPNVFTQVGSDTDWSVIRCGLAYSLALKDDGSLYGSGRNNKGNLGLGDGADRYGFEQETTGGIWNDIQCSYFSSLGRQGTTLYGCGFNSFCQLPFGNNTQYNEFTITTELRAGEYSIGCSSASAFTFVIKAPLVSGKHRSACGGINWQGKELVGDFANGLIYSLEDEIYTDNGQEITRKRRTQIINKNRVNVIHNRVEIEFEPGIGLDVASDVDGYDPQAVLKWSDDGGNTWSAGRSVSIGTYQQYGTRAIWRSLGKSRNRIYELTIESPVKIILIGTYAQFKACNF